MYKSNFKLFLLILALLSCYSDVLGQKSICKCKISDNYQFKNFERNWTNNSSRIDDIIRQVEKDGVAYYKSSHVSLEYIFKEIDEKFNELVPPYKLSMEYDGKGTMDLGYPNWVEEDPGIFSNIYIKTPFDTYINEQKDFDVMFGLQQVQTKVIPFIVVKNHFQAHEWNSITSIKLIIDDFEFSIMDRIIGFGTKYKEQDLAIKSGINTVAYRNVKLYRITLTSYSEFNRNREEFISDIISKIKAGKVSLVYETATGQVKRTFNETQVKSFKEMFQIYDKFLFNKFENRYINEDVKKECEELGTKVEEKNEAHYIKLQPIEDKINKFKEKYMEFY